MNDSSYTILIPALLLLSAAMVGMLYARFVSRSRENSEEIDLIDIELIPSRISAAEPGALQFEVDATERVPFLEPRPDMASVLEVAAAANDEEEEAPKRNETEYFDELQEAAAGLAALMRSSPVGKTAPVVYAPDEADEVFDKVDEPDDEPQEILLPVAELGSEVLEEAEEHPQDDLISDASDPAEALLEPTEADSILDGTEESSADSLIEGSPVTEALTEVEPPAEIIANEPEDEALSIRTLLGDDVADQLDSLDSELGNLQSLIVSIESALSSLNEGGQELNSEDDAEIVSEAA